MELKVWVEGIQRIVCGVSDGTTCQDVVYALAHATGKTGRFTLVEKWRNNERLLPPQEHPLKVLSKWGEYANDVQLVLRRTSLDSKSSALQAENVPTTKTVPGDGQTSINWQKSISPLSPTPTGRDLKKSLTFSAGGTLAASESDVGTSSKEKIIKDMKEASRMVSNRNNNLNNPPLLKKESNEKKQMFFSKSSDEISRDSINQISNKCIPERESILPISRFAVGPNTRNYNTNYASKTLSAKQQLATSRASIKNLDEGSARSSESLHSKSFGSDQTSSISDHLNNSDNGISRIPTVTPQSNSSRITSQEVAGLTNSNKPPSLIPVRRIETSSRNVQDEIVRRTNYPVPVHVGAIKASRRNVGDTKKIVIEEETREDTVLGNGQQEKVIYDHCYRDLVRLINLQREKISQQQAGLTQCDAEIMFWEEKQKDHQRQIEKIEREMEKMESSGRDLNEEVNQLDLLHLDDELDVGRQQEKMLQSELTLLRSKLSNCETELLQCKNKIRLLMDDISEDRRWKSKEEEERRHRERIVLSEIDDLQGELQQIVKDYDSKIKSCDKLEGEVKHLESAISIKKKQVEGLVQEMKAANLESLALTPAEEIRNLLEGGAHKGPGSSRKIVGSPRQLENAVPTSKNPHGVWV